MNPIMAVFILGIRGSRLLATKDAATPGTDSAVAELGAAFALFFCLGPGSIIIVGCP